MNLRDFLGDNTDEHNKKSDGMRNLKIDDMRDFDKARIHIIKVENVDDAKRPVNFLKEGAAIIADTTSLKDVDRVKAYSFLSGACYLDNSQMATIAPQIYLITPQNFIVDSDIDKPNFETKGENTAENHDTINFAEKSDEKSVKQCCRLIYNMKGLS